MARDPAEASLSLRGRGETPCSGPGRGAAPCHCKRTIRPWCTAAATLTAASAALTPLSSSETAEARLLACPLSRAGTL